MAVGLIEYVITSSVSTSFAAVASPQNAEGPEAAAVVKRRKGRRRPRALDLGPLSTCRAHPPQQAAMVKPSTVIARHHLHDASLATPPLTTTPAALSSSDSSVLRRSAMTRMRNALASRPTACPMSPYLQARVQQHKASQLAASTQFSSVNALQGVGTEVGLPTAPCHNKNLQVYARKRAKQFGTCAIHLVGWHGH